MPDDTQTTPWHVWREVAFAIFNWSPETFWAATPHDWCAALKGFQRKNKNQHALDDEVIDELRALLNKGTPHEL